MTLSEFEQEIRKLNPEFQVMRAKADSLTAAVLFRGVFQFAIPANGLYKEKNDSYGFEHPTSGQFLRHRTIGESMAMAKNIIKQMNKGSEDYRAQMGLGEFSDANLKKIEPTWGRVENEKKITKIYLDLDEVKNKAKVVFEIEDKRKFVLNYDNSLGEHIALNVQEI